MSIYHLSSSIVYPSINLPSLIQIGSYSYASTLFWLISLALRSRHRTPKVGNDGGGSCFRPRRAAQGCCSSRCTSGTDCTLGTATRPRTACICQPRPRQSAASRQLRRQDWQDDRKKIIIGNNKNNKEDICTPQGYGRTNKSISHTMSTFSTLLSLYLYSYQLALTCLHILSCLVVHLSYQVVNLFYTVINLSNLIVSWSYLFFTLSLSTGLCFLSTYLNLLSPYLTFCQLV